jgi:hypothetical protein
VILAVSSDVVRRYLALALRLMGKRVEGSSGRHYWSLAKRRDVLVCDQLVFRLEWNAAHGDDVGRLDQDRVDRAERDGPLQIEYEMSLEVLRVVVGDANFAPGRVKVAQSVVLTHKLIGARLVTLPIHESLNVVLDARHGVGQELHSLDLAVTRAQRLVVLCWRLCGKRRRTSTRRAAEVSTADVIGTGSATLKLSNLGEVVKLSGLEKVPVGHELEDR